MLVNIPYRAFMVQNGLAALRDFADCAETQVFV